MPYFLHINICLILNLNQKSNHIISKQFNNISLLIYIFLYIFNKWWSNKNTHKIRVPIITNQTASINRMKKSNKSVKAILKLIPKIKIVSKSKKDSTNYNKKNKKSSPNSNNFHMDFYFNKKHNSKTQNLHSPINSKTKTIKRSLTIIKIPQINPETNTHQNNSPFIQDHIKKHLKYSNHQDKSQ